MFKNILRRLVGERTIGMLEYFLMPRLKDNWGGPFNGQEYRQRIYGDLIERIPFEAIVETGTYRGATTALLAESGLPVYTVEASPRFYAYAKLRLRSFRECVHLLQGDSRGVLEQLSHDPEMTHDAVFFYLDAHWRDDLPLREEVQLIFSHWGRAVVMVDDFEVPGTKYSFDDYGPDKVLNLTYLEPLDHLHLRAYFPAMTADEETGARRGCVVLCNDPVVARTLDDIDTLRSHSSASPLHATDC